jgi:putative oxidoreductase
MPQPARSTESVLLWILSVLLAAVFLLAGIPKILGMETVWLQAAAMRGFPAWIRVISGIVEVVAAIGLLVPRAAAPAAGVLALLMIPATFTQYVSDRSAMLFPIALFVLLVVLAWRRSPDTFRRGYRSVAASGTPLVRAGIIAGLIGAMSIAVWFFGVDLVAGRPFFTPATLGRALIRVFGPVPADQSTATLVIMYTIFHFAAFIAVGLLASLVVHLASREPSVLVGFIVLFAAFEVGFYALVGLLQEASALGTLAWYQVMLGNLIAAAAMGTYLLRANPQLREQLTHAWESH